MKSVFDIIMSFQKPKKERPATQGYDELIRENKDFETYYKVSNKIKYYF